MYTISTQDYGSHGGGTRFEGQALSRPSSVSLRHSGARSIGFAVSVHALGLQRNAADSSRMRRHEADHRPNDRTLQPEAT